MLIKKLFTAVVVSLIIVACSNTKIVEPQPEPVPAATPAPQQDTSILKNK